MSHPFDYERCTKHPNRPSANAVWKDSLIDFREPRCQQCFEKVSSDAAAQASYEHKYKYDVTKWPSRMPGDTGSADGMPLDRPSFDNSSERKDV